MNEAMGRYACGARGGAVIPDGSGGDASGGMTGGGGTIDVSYSVERTTTSTTSALQSLNAAWHRLQNVVQSLAVAMSTVILSTSAVFG